MNMTRISMGLGALILAAMLAISAWLLWAPKAEAYHSDAFYQPGYASVEGWYWGPNTMQVIWTYYHPDYGTWQEIDYFLPANWFCPFLSVSMEINSPGYVVSGKIVTGNMHEAEFSFQHE